MRTLFITHHYIDTPGGGAYASTAYINAFAEISDSITLLYPYKGRHPIHLHSKVIAIPVEYNKPTWRKCIDLLLGFVHRYIGVAEKYVKGDFDTVVFDTSIVSFKLISLFKEAGKRTICIHHNYQYEYFKDNTKWPLSIPTLFWCKRYERDAVRHSDLNLTLTKEDEFLLRKNYGTGNETFKQIGVFEYDSKPLPELSDKANTVPVFVITGSLGSYQTEQSLLPWIHNYYPLVCKEFPNHVLLLAGKNPTEKLYQVCAQYANIRVFPNPKDMDEILKQANYYICPTSMGGGLKLRIMDGLRYGLAVSTHSVSARGYDAFRDKCLFVYQSKDEFVNSIKKMVRCKMTSQEIVDCFQEEFSFAAGINRLKAIVK